MLNISVEFIKPRPITDSKTGEPVYWDAVYVGMRAPGCWTTAEAAVENARRYFSADETLDTATGRWTKIGYDWTTAPGRIAGLA